MEPKIEACTSTDVDAIFELYQMARNLQTARGTVIWPFFDRTFINKEIEEGRQWKLRAGNDIACNWAITYDDRDIWEEKEKGDAIYIHRIATHIDYRGSRFIHHIAAWAKEYARTVQRPFVRLDTLGNNTRLIEHYTSAGFDFLGIVTLKNTANLPAHYQREPKCCLFELHV